MDGFVLRFQMGFTRLTGNDPFCNFGVQFLESLFHNHFRMQSKKFKGLCGFPSLLHSKRLLALNLMYFVPAFPCFPLPVPASVNVFHSLYLAHTGPFYQRTFTPEASSHILAVK